MRLRQAIGLVVSVLVAVVALWAVFATVEYLDAKQVIVIQYPTGRLKVGVQPGPYLQWFGSVTKYKKRDQFWFSMAGDQGKKIDESIAVRFNDGGHARISGSIAWEMPTDERNLIALHMQYGSHHAIEQQLVRTVLEKAIYMTGPLMSSMESYAARRSELLNLIDDQVVHGVFKTEARQDRLKDPMTGIEKTVTVVQIVRGPDGKYLRQDRSPLEEFGIKTFNLAINRVPYATEVEAQIKQQQEAIMQVQTAFARAKEAEQDAVTAEKRGQANAAQAKWEQEVHKAKAVTLAKQKLEVAQLAAQEAEQYKISQLRRAEGDSEYKRKVMQADGGLEAKLAVLKDINEFYADAIKEHKGPWVPNVVMGGGGTASTPGGVALPLIDLLTAHTAKQLGLDMGVSGKEKTRQ